ncbi:unnamed protein product [Arabis nemorensis]|uniref:2-on-2 hemoglobin n=1 Tax=Arabis nemorensis TaxID=586526 RepID=A0A565CAQ3_9BRAS|nr:unnamed protein product [Arabis nemorensis]
MERRRSNRRVRHRRVQPVREARSSMLHQSIHQFLHQSRVYDDEEEWFRSMFSNSKKEDAIQNQYEFFVQRMGGPPLYSQRKGHPALIGRHRPFPVTHEAAERWLRHMQNALDDSLDIDQDSKVKMMNFFRHTAFFLVAGNELKNQNQNQTQNNQVACKHAANKPAEE